MKLDYEVVYRLGLWADLAEDDAGTGEACSLWVDLAKDLSLKA
jgi:hypothetical protein